MKRLVRHSFGSIRLIGVVALVAAFTCTAPILAQESAEDYIEPRIDRTHFVALYQQLALESSQRTIAELAFTDYTAAIVDLTRSLNEQADKVGRQPVKNALAGKSRLAPDDLQRMRIAVLKVYEQAGPAADQALQELLGGVQSVLTPEQSQHFDVALRQLRRDILLHSRQTDSSYQEYAGDGVDVLDLVETARKDGGELQPLDREALSAVLNQYEQQMDALLIETSPGYRSGKILRKIASIEKNAAAMHEQEQAALARWKLLYELNENTVQQIGEMALASLGEQAKQRWLDRFDQASFMWLYPRKKPDRQIEWIRLQHAPGLPAEKLEQAEQIYDGYLQRRRELSRQAIEMMIRGRLEFQTMLYSMMDASNIDDRLQRDLYQELLKNTGEQANLESTTSGALEAVLNDAQREALREAMKKPDAAARRR